MSIMNCPECKKEISDSVKTCPHCGYKIPKKRKKLSKGLVIGSIVLIGIIFATTVLYFSMQLSDAEKKAVEAVNRLIEENKEFNISQKSIPELQTALDDYKQIENSYNKLSWKEKRKISGYDKIENLEEEIKNQIKTVNDKAAKNAEDKIAAIGTVNLDSSNLITSAESAYKALTDEQQKLVSNYDVLVKAKSDYSELEIKNVINKIDAIGTVKLTKSCKNKIDSAQLAYNLLSSETKSKITNAGLLKSKIDKYEKLETKKKKQENINKAKKSIKITSMFFDMNSVGGCDVYIYGYNRSGKTIKYITFTVSYYNAVGDRIFDEISYSDSKNLQCVGPIKNGGSFGDDSYWEAAWYNTTTTKMKLDKVKIEYSNGSKYTITKDYIKYIK